MAELEEVEYEFRKFLLQGYNREDAAKEAVYSVFKGRNYPHIYRDQYHDPSHIFQGDYVYHFGGGIFKKV